MNESVSLAEVIAAAQGRHASLVPETSGYILLGVVRAMGGRPMKVDPSDIRLDTDGVVTIEGRRERRAPSVTAAGLRELLRRLLRVGQGNPTTLAAVADPPDGSPVPLDKLFTGVTRALIPINRSAATRALARVARETLRAKARRLDDEALNEAMSGWDDAAAEAPVSSTEIIPTPPTPAESAAQPPEPAPPHEPIAAVPSSPPPTVAVSTRTPSPTPSVAIDVAEDDEWDDIDADIDLLTPTPRPTIEPTPTLADPTIDEQHEVAAIVTGAREVVAASAQAGESSEPREEEGASIAAPHAPSEDDDLEVVVAPMVALTPPPTTVTHDDDDLSWSLHAPVAPVDPPTAASAESIEEQPAEPTTGSEEADAGHTPAAGGAQLNPAPVEPQAPAPVTRPQSETELAEILYQAAASLRPSGARPQKPSFAKAPEEQGSVEDLLEQLDASDRDEDPVLAAAASLQKMMGLDLSPLPGAVVVMHEDEAPYRRPSLIDLPVTPEPRDDLDALESQRVSIPLDEEDVSAPIALDAQRSDDVDALDGGGDDDIDEHELDDGDALNDEDELEDELDDHELDDDGPCPIESTEDGDVAQSISPPPAAVADRFTVTPPPRMRWVTAAGAALMVAAGLVAAQGFMDRGPLDLLADEMNAPTSSAASSPQCVAELRLHDLPEHHEILLGLGEAPLTTRPVPTGVRLELVATAAAFEPERVVIPVDANWVEVEPGRRQLAVSMTLEPGVSDHWPPAAAGKVGGMGPAGRIHVATNPNAEIWLVAAAGRGADATIHVACGADANLLIVDPDQPRRQRRLSVASALLDTAARSGGADLSGKL